MMVSKLLAGRAAVLLVVLTLLLPAPTPVQAIAAVGSLDAVCVNGTVAITWDALTTPPGTSYAIHVNGTQVATGQSGVVNVPGTGIMTVQLMADDGSGPYVRMEVTVTCQGDPGAGCAFADGRVNAAECAPPVVPFCLPYGIYVYAIDPETGEGSQLMMVRDEVLAAIGVPEENTPLAQANGVILSRLMTGEYQINALDFEGNPYVLVWDDCPPGEVYLIK